MIDDDIESPGGDIAIVGLSGRFPGAADVGELWTAIREGNSGISRFTDDELRAAGVAEDLIRDPAYVKASPVVDGIDLFDAEFFGVSPKEAQILDPQQRLFLENSWAALEDAGCDPARFDGAVGVFGGCGHSHYMQNNLLPSGMNQVMGDLALGLANDKDSLTTRVAHTLGLSGPTYGVQSYCSTSLVAVCAAATSLAGFECDLALAGGVALNVPHRVGYVYQQGGIAPPDGLCHAFDAGGLGAPLGSGVGVVALRRLEDAQADGDRIYAVIRGWAVNNDAGRKAGFTAPGVQGQSTVMAEALASAGLSPADIDYVEAHGTGTALGDSVELAAIHQVFAGESLLIGSVKTNVGHLDRAAGVTNLIKAALAIKRGEIPATLNLDVPNPRLADGEARLEVVTGLRPWPERPERTKRAGVSAFGVGGTNAHVVIEEPPPVPRADDAPRPEVLVWSARTAAAADAATERLAAHLSGEGRDDRLADIAHTLQIGRKVFAHRRMLVASSTAEATEVLGEAAALGRADDRTDRPVGFLIAGTGEQYPGMAADLYESEPIFRQELDRCRAELRRRMDGRDPLEEMLNRRPADDGGLARLMGRAAADATPTDVLQPALFAVEYALARLVQSWGVQPSVLAGYSLGEYVAACIAGVFSLESALALVTQRARLIAELPAGEMAAVPLSGDDLSERLRRAEIGGVDVAAVSGPALTVLAGEPDAMARVRALLEADSVPCRPLATTHAFHSAMMEPARAPLTGWIAENITLNEPVIPCVSNVTGDLATAEQLTDPAYWAQHMCGTVQFDRVLQTLLHEDGDPALLEIGPGQSLGTMVRGHRDCPPDRWALAIPTLPAEDDPRPAGTVLAEALGRLWLTGVPVDWAGHRGDRQVTKVGLPTYPFERESYWVDASGPVAAPAVRSPEPERAHVELMVPQWTERTPYGEAPGEPPGRCVVLADAGGVAQELIGRLVAEDLEVVVADPADPAGPARGLDGGEQAVVVDLRPLNWSVDAADLVPLARTYGAWGEKDGDGTRVLVATRAAYAVTGQDSPSPGQAAAATLPMVANQEYLNLACTAVDFAADAGVTDVAAGLAAEMLQSSDEVLVAYRDGTRLAREFVAEPEAEPVPVAQGGTYLITGGLGDVGRLLAGHLAEAGAGRLILASRGGIPDVEDDPRRQTVEGLRARGTEVLTPRVDITDADAMREMLTGALGSDGRLDGVIHAAADTSADLFQSLRDIDEEAVGGLFGAKVAGARVLEEVLGGLPEAQRPGFCVLFSSTSAVLGGIAFAGYAAANAALTAIGQRNHGRTGTRWVAANWDTWAVSLERLEGGFGATMAAHSMSVEQSMAALDRLMGSDHAAVVVAAGGLEDRLPTAGSYLGTAEAAQTARGTGERFPRPELPQPYVAPRSQTERDLAELWSDVLGVEPVGTRDNFFDLGGNSLVALQMLSLVKQRFGQAVPAVTLFEAPAVGALAAILDERAEPEPADVAQGPALVPSVVERPDATEDQRIAIVGMAGRFPGAPDVRTFWQNLRDGVESITFFSEEELLAAGVDQDSINDPAYVPARPVLDDVSGFDASFFGMSPRMAAVTDPQQRAFLEVCWEALEQAGYAAAKGRGRVGVFGGSNISTYLLGMTDYLLGGAQADYSDFEVIMGNDKDALTTTVSYLFDLYGPSVAVGTFCSTSLVAAHHAVQSLRAGECEMALAGGVSIRVPDRVGHVFGPGGQSSPDGHVRTFDAEARGSMFGDGAAAVVLKRLPDAVRDGDHIWAVIRGSAMNNDGALKVGYAAPSVVGQARVISDAMADAGVTADDMSYIEAHGTATELGDPIEVAALTRAFGRTREKQYCPIGSVKTNVGHLDRAAGASGLIKTALALHEGVIPPSLHYTTPNPEIDFEESPFYVNIELSPWRDGGGNPRIAGLNSLGMGGTNVHMVVEEPPNRTAKAQPARRHQLLPISARTSAAADQACERLGDHLAAGPESGWSGARLCDVAYTLQEGRKTFEHRRVLVTDDLATAAGALRTREGVLSRVETMEDREVAFLFAGVGEQYAGLAGDLYRHEPAFRAVLDECLDLIGEPGLNDVLTGDRDTGSGLAALMGREVPGAGQAAELERTEIVQPAMFAVEYALARTLMGWGVEPRLMLGYSLGEYVAACIAGVLSLRDAISLVTYRARLISGRPAGSMLAVSLPEGKLRRRFRLKELGLDIAVINGPQVTVVAGPDEPVAELAERLRAAEVPCRPLQTTHAFHSRMLEPIGEELTQWIEANITLNPPALPYISNLTGEIAGADLVCAPGYWARHMCETVRFGAGMDTLLAEPELAVAEIGPGQSLGAMLRSGDCPTDRWPLITHTLPAASDTRTGDEVFTAALARLWLCGVTVDWAAYHGRTDDGDPDVAPGRVPLPTYPFQRQRYWIEPPSGGGPAAVASGASPVPDNLFEAVTGLPKLPESDWLYLPVWRQTAPGADDGDGPGSVVIFTREGLADAAVADLRRVLSVPISLVRPGDAYGKSDDGYTIRPGNVADAIALLRDLRIAGHRLERVIHLWTLEAAPLETTVRLGLHSLVALARAAGESGIGEWSLDVAVSGSRQVLGADVDNPAAATLTGPCLVIPLEYPGVTTRLVDLPGRPQATDLSALAAELGRPQQDRTVALRNGRRWVPGHERMPGQSLPAGGSLRDGGVYLITGGLGGIALGLAEHLVRDCRAKLVLLARNGLPPQAEWPGILADPAADETVRLRVSEVTKLLELGAEVEIVTGDVARKEDVRRAVDLAVERFGALHGVLHAAGVPAMGLMQFKRPEELDAVLAPKIDGTLALADALRIGEPDEIELDFLMLFSSITSATGGGPGQVDYCAANAYLDAYAQQLALTGRRVLSVGWGEWTWNAWEAGLTGYEDELADFFRENRRRVGIGFEDGWRALLRTLATGEPQVVVSTQDFPTLVAGSSRFTIEVVTAPSIGDAGRDRHPRPELLTSYQEPSGPTEEAIAAIWCESLRLDRVGVLDNYFELGGNSLLGVAIVAAVRREFELAELPPHILYESPTVAALSQTVEALASGESGTASASTTSDGGSQVRAQLRRSGLEASAARRRGR